MLVGLSDIKNGAVKAPFLMTNYSYYDALM